MKVIKIEWGGETYTINENEAFEIGERIEDIITMGDLAKMQMEASPKFRKLSRCFAEMINFAGGRASPQDVHTQMMAQIKSTEATAPEDLFVTIAINTLLEIMMDGVPEGEGGDDAEKKK